MNRRRIGRPLYGLGASALLVAGIVSAGSAVAQDGASPLISADVEATVVVTGGDAQGGDAIGGDAGLVASITDAGSTSVSQEADLLQGGMAVGGDAQGGAGLDAYIDADVILDADIALDVAADVNVNTVAGANLNLPDVPIDGVIERSAGQTVPDGIAGGLGDVRAPRAGTADLPNLGGGLPNADTSALGGLPSADLGSALGGLSGLNLLDLVAVLDVEVTGGDAVGGTAVGGSALLQATIDGGGSSGKASGPATVHQVADEVFGGDATGGQAIGGDGIELDLLLDADIDLVVDADVDLAADVDTFIEADLGGGGGGQRQGAQLARFESE